jgi:hypothetical protein
MRRAQSIALGAALALAAGCGEPSPEGGGGAGGAADAGPPPPGSGCADGTREAFVDTAAWPDVAGCAGGFSIPGIAAGEPLAPACGRAAGDSGDDPAGSGCSAADLCAEGWHVCGSAAELGAASRNAGCDPAAEGFFATRQAQEDDACQGPPAVDNLVGCGTLGAPAPPDRCAPLARVLRWDHCEGAQTWACGTEADPSEEARIVHKSGPAEGGVACCRDPS